MRKIISLPIAGVIILGAISCQNENRNNRDTAATNITDTTTDTTSRAQIYTSDVDLQGNEKIFILTALNNLMLDIETSRIVETKTNNALIKSFAKKLVAASTKLNTDLVSIAKGKGIDPPNLQSEENIKKINGLKTLSGKLLDDTYIKLVSTALASNDVIFGKAATFKNKDLKTFAINALSDIQKNHKEALEIGEKLNVGNQTNGNKVR